MTRTKYTYRHNPKRFRVTVRIPKPDEDGFICEESPDVYVNGILCKRIEGCSGDYRYVGRTSQGFIIKLDHMSDPEDDFYTQTDTEIKTYQTIRAKHLKYFPKLLAWGTVRYQGADCAWLIEKFIKRSGRIFTVKMSDLIADIAYDYDIADLPMSYKGCHLPKWANVLITTKGQPVIIDWGVAQF